MEWIAIYSEYYPKFLALKTFGRSDVTPPTDAEVKAMQSAPKTFVDRVMNEAIKHLSSK
ncbi:hypothetical protein C8J95_10599 [Elizabethkingia sp. YR214]|nr:hypothetical protein C8J95_10599 [Elizabethkingia sp. YR214]